MIDTRNCKHCGIEFSKVSLGQILGDYDGTFNEGYCNKFCRMEHEKQLISEGRLELEKGIPGVLIDSKYRDSKGNPVWFPKDGRAYYDRALGRKFHSKAEKCQYMNAKGIIMDGSSDPIKWPEASGDMKNKSYRKEVWNTD